MNRLEANVKIISVLTEYLDDNPECRFIQALWNLGIIDRESSWNPGEINPPIDRFYEESKDTLNRMEKHYIK